MSPRKRKDPEPDPLLRAFPKVARRAAELEQNKAQQKPRPRAKRARKAASNPDAGS